MVKTANNYDVIVVGAGLAGLTAARELGAKDLRVLVVEARERIGGRIYTAPLMGQQLELGGNWLHWSQPHVWAEITRYGLPVDRGPQAEEVLWLADGEVQRSTPEELLKMLDEPTRQLVSESATLLPRPDQLASGERWQELDRRTLQEALDGVQIPAAQRDLHEAIWVGHCNGPLAAVAYTAALRWAAAGLGQWQIMHASSGTYRISGGNQQLVAAIAADVRGEIRLNTVVTQVRHGQDWAEIDTAEGETFSAKRVVLTQPLNILHEVPVIPPLHETKQDMSRLGSASNGFKLWIRVQGRVTPFAAYSSQHHPIAAVRCEFVSDQDSVLVAFGANGAALDVHSIAAVSEQLRVWRDDLTVLEVQAHPWLDDEFTKETWMMHRPGMYTAAQAELQRPEGAIHYASADTANLWPCFFDGAIESAMCAAHKINAELAAPNS